MEKLRLHTMLKRLLEEQGTGLRKLSRATGIAESTLSGYANGIEPKKLQHVRSIAKHFNVSLEQLLFGEEPPAPNLDQLPSELLFNGWLKVRVERLVPGKKRPLDDD